MFSISCQTRTRDADSIPLVVTFVRRLLLIIARPARLLECLEFDPSEFYQMLEVAESHVRHRTNSVNVPGSQIISADVPLYIISKLGLSKTVLDGKFKTNLLYTVCYDLHFHFHFRNSLFI